MTSADGENFEEASCWKAVGTDQGEFDQNIMFDDPKSVKAVSIVMRQPGKQGYFGIQQVAMLADREDPVMLVNGIKEEAAVNPGEAETGYQATGTGLALRERVLARKQCLAALDEASVGVEKCQTALLSKEQRGLFKLNAKDQLEHVSGKCVTISSGSNPENGGDVELKDCADDQDDGDFQWTLTDKGQLKAKYNNYCLMPANSLKEEEVAQGGTVHSTSSQEGHGAEGAVDGDSQSYWASGFDPATDAPVEYRVDLDGEKSVENVEIEWEYPAKAFDVQVAAKDGAWTTIFSTNSNNSMKTTITAPAYPSEIMERISKDNPSIELPHDSSSVRVVMRETHPDFGVEQGKSLYGISNLKVSASGSKKMIVKDCDQAEMAGADDKRDRWFPAAGIPIMETARRKLEPLLNFL